MKSSPHSTEYKTLAEPTPVATAPPTQFIRRGFRDVEAQPPPSDTYDAETLGTIQRLPLAIQAAFRRKLIAIIALQLFVVSVAMAVIEFGSAAACDWIANHIVHETAGLVAVCVATLALLLLLYVVRNAYPLNWAVLLLFSAVQTLCFVVADLSLDSHAVVSNCIFTWVCATLMVTMAGWTHDHAHGCWRGHSCAWQPAADDDLEGNTSRKGPQLVPAFAQGLAAFVPMCLLVLILHWIRPFGLHWSASSLAISFFAQLIVGFWLVYEIDRMHREKTPDAYMGGVIHLYTDLVAAVAAVATVIAACMCFAAAGDDGGVGVTALANADFYCCLCVDSAARTNAAMEEDY